MILKDKTYFYPDSATNADPIQPFEPVGLTLIYGELVNEGVVRRALIHDNSVTLAVPDGDGVQEIGECSTSAYAEDWVRLVFKTSIKIYEYETGKGWESTDVSATPYSKPAGGIPATDLDQGVLETLSNAVELPETAANGSIMVFMSGGWTPIDLAELMLEQGLYTPDLAKDSWSMISKISASGTAANYYAVGDAKAITLDGTMGTLELDMDTYVFILGFDHNAEIEGNGITFGGFKTSAGNDAVDICLTDSGDTYFTIDGSKHFNMNHWGEIYPGPKGDEERTYNYGGWSGSDMRYDILGSTDVAPDNYGEMPTEGHHAGNDPTATCATNPVANTLMSCLPAALRAVMKPITKYTDNVGGGNGNVEANVTATVDYLPLCSEYEVHGANTVANFYEVEHQAQYAYYASGNSKVKYKHSDTSSAAVWWVRSPNRGSSGDFCGVYGNGDAGIDCASDSVGVSPLFKV